MTTSEKKKVEVVAPASLAEGFLFQTSHAGKSLTVTVPPGGVRKGTAFMSSLPSDFDVESVRDELEEETNGVAPGSERSTEKSSERSTGEESERSTANALPPPNALTGGEWGDEWFLSTDASSSCGCFAFFSSRRPKEEKRIVYATKDGKFYDENGRETTGGHGFEPFERKENG